MDIIISIIAIVWTLLGIILFFKIWGMTNDVRKLCEKFVETGKHNPPYEGCVPNAAPELSVKSIELVKNRKYNIEGYGECTYNGMFNGNCYFYPEKTSGLPVSEFLIDGAEPYLNIPPRSLSLFVITPVSDE